jgi:hypothetical protein
MKDYKETPMAKSKKTSKKTAKKQTEKTTRKGTADGHPTRTLNVQAIFEPGERPKIVCTVDDATLEDRHDRAVALLAPISALLVEAGVPASASASGVPAQVEFDLSGNHLVGLKHAARAILADAEFRPILEREPKSEAAPEPVKLFDVPTLPSFDPATDKDDANK